MHCSGTTVSPGTRPVADSVSVSPSSRPVVGERLKCGMGSIPRAMDVITAPLESKLARPQDPVVQFTLPEPVERVAATANGTWAVPLSGIGTLVGVPHRLVASVAPVGSTHCATFRLELGVPLTNTWMICPSVSAVAGAAARGCTTKEIGALAYGPIGANNWSPG